MTEPIRPRPNSNLRTTHWGLRAPKRDDPLPPRDNYASLIARDYAERGHTKFAELIELGHACAACLVTRATNGVPSDRELALDRYAKVTLALHTARTTLEILQGAYLGALSSLEARVANAARRIRVDGLGHGARDEITLQQIGRELAENPVAHRAYTQVQRQGTEVVLDFKHRPPDILGEAMWLENRIIVYVAKHPNAKSAVATLVHETSHIHRFARGHINDLRDELKAHTREFLYTHGRRPSRLDRALLEKQVRRAYPELE